MMLETFQIDSKSILNLYKKIKKTSFFDVPEVNESLCRTLPKSL